jgi:phosphate transport system substrate-binding protein
MGKMKKLEVKLKSRILLLSTTAKIELLKMKNLWTKVLFTAGLMLVSTMAFAGQTLNGAGATFPYPLYSKWFYEYAKQTGVQINYQAIGSGGGIQQIIAKTVDFGASDAPLDADTLNKYGLIQMPTVAGAVAMAYNIPGIGKGLKFTPELIAGIYLGKITRWDDPEIKAVNPDLKLPSLPIIVVHRSDGSGTTNIFTTYLSAVSKEWSDKVGHSTSVNWPVGIGGKGNAGVAGFISQTKGSVGYVELAYVLQNKMSYGPVKNESGVFVWPTIESAKAAAASVREVPADFNIMFVNAPGKNSYPIAGFTFLIIYKHQTNPEKGKELLKFIHWIYSKGEKMAPSLDYVPLPEGLIEKINTQLKEVTIEP